MYIECNIKDIQKVISFAEKVSSKNSTLPVLESIVFEAHGNSCELRSTNLSLGFMGSVPASVKSDGVVAVKASIIAPVITNLNEEGIVSLQENDGYLIVSTRNTTAKCLMVPNDDFPIIPFGGDNKIEIKKEDFLGLIKTTYFSASQSEIKPELASVYIYSKEGYMYAVATDGYRLSEKKIKNDTNDFSLLIPVKNASDIIRIVSDWSDEISLSYNKNQLTLSDLKNQYLLTTRIIEGSFPDYKQIVPKEHQTKVILLKDDILKNIRLSNIFTDKFYHIKLNIDSVNKNLSIYAGNSESGEIESIIPAKIEGDGLVINFNYKYFMDCFQAIDDQTIVLNLTATNKPMIIEGLSTKDYIYLLMPINR